MRKTWPQSARLASFGIGILTKGNKNISFDNIFG